MEKYYNIAICLSLIAMFLMGLTMGLFIESIRKIRERVEDTNNSQKKQLISTIESLIRDYKQSQL